MLEHPKSHADYQGETGMDITMDNQQEILTQAEIGWLAGIIEGEGSVCMNARKKHWKGWNGFGVDLRIMAVNSDAGIIKKCVDIFRKLGINPHIQERGAVPIPKRDSDDVYQSVKTMLTLTISRMGDIKKVLEIIIPHTAGEKKERAELIVDFINRRQTRKGDRTKEGSAWMNHEEWGIVEKFYELKGGAPIRPEVREFLNEHTPPSDKEMMCSELIGKL
jgi:hypothetical protein